MANEMRQIMDYINNRMFWLIMENDCKNNAYSCFTDSLRYIPPSMRSSHKARSMSSPGRAGVRTSSESSDTSPQDAKSERPQSVRDRNSPVAGSKAPALRNIAENDRVPTYFTEMPAR